MESRLADEASRFTAKDDVRPLAEGLPSAEGALE